jgi:hypothetical protein
MIYVKGFGQMCNNILQFGHLYAWGEERNLPVTGLRFCYKYSYFAINKKKSYNWLTYLFAKYGAKWGFIPTISFLKEEDVNSQNINQLVNARYSCVEGWYLRDYNIFLRHRDELKELFAFNEKVKRSVKKSLPPKAPGTIRLGVHVRRGDYKTWMNGNYYYSDTEFIRVIQSFIDLFSENAVEIIVVSNTKDVCKEQYKASIAPDIHFCSGNPGEDLYALSVCDYIMGPPSTFSLMASFYNDAPLYWIFDKSKDLQKDSFKKFDYLFQCII